MKYCTHCGRELFDEAIVCVGCGCAVKRQNAQTCNRSVDRAALLNTLSKRLNINGIIWLVIGILQILGGLFFNWFLLIVGVLNIISSIQDIQYSKRILENPTGIVSKFEHIVGPIIVMAYNLIIGGVIGVIGSIFYLIAIRSYVMENKMDFASFDTENN